MRIPSTVLVITLLLVSLSQAEAKVQSKTIDYKDGDVALQGYLAWDDAIKGKRPAVLVVHEWWGLNDYARRRANMLAEMGYVAFALDMYGKGRVTTHPAEAREWSGVIRQKVKEWQQRAQLGLDVLRREETVDAERVATIGYCFGGATVMQLAYAGAPVKGVVSFHGSLPAPEPGQGKDIKAKVLVCHGADDGFIPPEEIKRFCEALNHGKADWQFVSYSGARHSFTNPEADKVGIEGIKYNANADRRSWEHMRFFLREVFGEK